MHDFIILDCKLFILGLLLIEDLGELHTGEVFRQEGIHIGDRCSFLTEEFLDGLGEEIGDHKDDTYNSEQGC